MKVTLTKEAGLVRVSASLFPEAKDYDELQKLLVKHFPNVRDITVRQGADLNEAEGVSVFGTPEYSVKDAAPDRIKSVLDQEFRIDGKPVEVLSR